MVRSRLALTWLTVTLITTGLTACSQQNWYQAARSAQTAQCMKEPISEYDDCNQQSNETYENYKSSKEQLQNKENTAD